MTNRVPALALVLPLVLAHPAIAGAAAATAPAACSLAALTGTYPFAFLGMNVAKGVAAPFAVTGYEVYDGTGIMRSVTTNAAGKLARNVRQPGTYTVAADCTGTVTYADGTVYDLFVAPD